MSCAICDSAPSPPSIVHNLLVFPELSLTGYEPGVARSNAVCPEALVLDSLRCLAQGAHMTVVVGAPMLNGRDELYIAALAIRPDGSTLIYTKEYLHPGEEQTFAPGSGGPAFLIGDTKCGLGDLRRHNTLAAPSGRCGVRSERLCCRCSDHREWVRCGHNPAEIVCIGARDGGFNGELQWFYRGLGISRQERHLVRRWEVGGCK